MLEFREQCGPDVVIQRDDTPTQQNMPGLLRQMTSLDFRESTFLAIHLSDSVTHL